MEIAQTADLQLEELVSLYKKLVPNYKSLGEAAKVIAFGVRQKQFSLSVLKQLEPLAELIASVALRCRKELLSASNFFERLQTAQKNGVYSNANGNWSDQVKSLNERLSPFDAQIEDILKKIEDAGVTWQPPQLQPS